jgi:hypothetical protein
MLLSFLIDAAAVQIKWKRMDFCVTFFSMEVPTELMAARDLLRAS